jgi:hypothetical protein
MKALRRCSFVAVMLLTACSLSQGADTRQRLERINAVYRVNEPAPREGARSVAPWQQVEPLCQSRQQKRGGEIAQQVDTELARIRGSGSGARAAREQVQAQGRLRIAEGMLSEWRACLSEYGWTLVPRKAVDQTPQS